MRLPFVASILLLASSALANPNPDPRFRPGANHHVGDDSFVAKFGRMPERTDSEQVRMATHFEHVRAWLASRPATRPDLTTRRAQLLGYFDEYIAKGTTPKNTHLPWRTTVFIDDENTICAVGYLIERSVGRALPERIAATHRYDFIEDIAAAMPEVASWVADSGFTLEEISSIQPAYSSPHVEQWRTWDLVHHAPADGPFARDGVAGTFRGKTLDGTWTVTKNDVVVGKGELVRGNGTWRSYYPDGKKLFGEGPYAGNVAHGAWTLYHPSGNVAATGSFVHGMRAGMWTFYNDTPDKKPIARGAFTRDGRVTGTWSHYDGNGALLAHTYGEGTGQHITVEPNADGVVHETHQRSTYWQSPSPDYQHSLERFSLGRDQVYVHTTAYGVKDGAPGKSEIVYDADGHKLERGATGWTAANCHWAKKRIAVAKAGDVAWLHEILFSETERKAFETVTDDDGTRKNLVGDPGPTCDAAVAVDATRGALLDKLLAPRTAMRAQAPTFVQKLVLQEDDLDGEVKPDEERKPEETDLRHMLAAYTIDNVEWPHIDGRFARLFDTMAGRYHWEWAGSEPEADGTNPLENARKGG